MNLARRPGSQASGKLTSTVRVTVGGLFLTAFSGNRVWAVRRPSPKLWEALFVKPTSPINGSMNDLVVHLQGAIDILTSQLETASEDRPDLVEALNLVTQAAVLAVSVPGKDAGPYLHTRPEIPAPHAGSDKPTKPTGTDKRVNPHRSRITVQKYLYRQSVTNLWGKVSLRKPVNGLFRAYRKLYKRTYCPVGLRRSPKRCPLLHSLCTYNDGYGETSV